MDLIKIIIKIKIQKVTLGVTQLNHIALQLAEVLMLLDPYKILQIITQALVPLVKLTRKYKNGGIEHTSYPLQGWKAKMIYLVDKVCGKS